jgi:hypothetical protein
VRNHICSSSRRVVVSWCRRIIASSDAVSRAADAPPPGHGSMGDAEQGRAPDSDYVTPALATGQRHMGWGLDY